MKPFYFIALLLNRFALIINTIVPKTINIAYTIPTTLPRGCCKTKINMQCYESEKLAEHAIDSDFDHT
ncbi:hypothetical protein ABE52_09240, partial [Bacillus thuringiensis]|nr:hypothetical protein [Bacillus thuringiensis]